MRQPMDSKALTEGALFAALTAIFALLGLWIPPLKIVTNLIWTVPIVVVIIRHDLKIGVITTVVASALVLMMSDPVRAFFLILQFGGVGIIYGWLFKKQASPGKMIILGSLVAGLSMVLMLIFSSWMMGFDITTIDQQLKETVEPSLEMYRQMGLLERMADQGVTEQQLKQSMENLVAMFITLIPGVLIMSSIFAAVLNFLVARIIIKRLGYSVPYLPPFRKWQLPWYSIWGFIAGLAISLLGDVFSSTAVARIGHNILYIYVPFLLISGISVLVYFFKEKIKASWTRVILVFFVVLYWPVAMLMISLIGLFDPFFNWRKLGKETV